MQSKNKTKKPVKILKKRNGVRKYIYININTKFVTKVQYEAYRVDKKRKIRNKNFNIINVCGVKISWFFRVFFSKIRVNIVQLIKFVQFALGLLVGAHELVCRNSVTQELVSREAKAARASLPSDSR